MKINFIFYFLFLTFASCTFSNHKISSNVTSKDTAVLKVFDLFLHDSEKVKHPIYFVRFKDDSSLCSFNLDTYDNREFFSSFDFNTSSGLPSQVALERLRMWEDSNFKPNKDFALVLFELNLCLKEASKEYDLSKLGSINLHPALIKNFNSIILKEYKNAYKLKEYINTYKNKFQFDNSRKFIGKLEKVVYTLPHTKQIDSIIRPYHLKIDSVRIDEFYELSDSNADFNQFYVFKNID